MDKIAIGTKVREIFSGKICIIVADKENPLMPNKGVNVQPIYPIVDNDCILRTIDAGEFIHAAYNHLDFV